jgi:glucose-1-phosphate cytidylyltransferase
VKVGILAGGLGTRLAEETETRPKPMVEVGGMPILWHILRYYSAFGHNDFAVALGYKGDYIKRWFREHVSSTSNVRVDYSSGAVTSLGESESDTPPWTIDLVETGLPTATGGRIKRLKPYLGDDTCMVTWGDGVATVDLDRLLEFHKAHGKLATLTAARPPARFGHLEFDGDRIVEFNEKPQTGEGWINGAFFVFEPGVFDYIDGDDTQFEREPLENLAKDGQLMAYKHDGFWQCMDTIRDKKRLEDLWAGGDAPWKIW